MNDLEEQIIRKLMKKLTNDLRICVHKVYTKFKPQTIEQLIALVKKCITDKGGMSESDVMKRISELENFTEELKKGIDELEELMNPKKKPLKKPKDNTPNPNSGPPKR